MPSIENKPTRYPEINCLMQRLLADVQRVLGEQFIGLYLHGSLTGADFNPDRSDIDFLVVTDGKIEGDVLPLLANMHAEISDSALKWAEKLEGSYLPLEALRRYDPANAVHPALNSFDGSFGLDGHGPDWVIQMYVLREQGITLSGPPPKNLIEPISPEDLRRAAQAVLEEWWAPMLENPARLKSREYQAYAALTMCRCLYTFEHGTVGAKTVAAVWAKHKLRPAHAALVEQALNWPHGQQPDRLAETLDFIRWTIDRSRAI
jgi:hypothetical protein